MAANQLVQARIDGTIKAEAAAVLAEIGLTISDFVRLGLTRVAREKAMPFELHTPNRLTAETLAKSARGEDLYYFDNAEAMFKDLGI